MLLLALVGARPVRADPLGPYFLTGAAAPAREAFQSKNYQRAAAVLRRYLRRARPRHRVQAQFLLAYALLQTGSPDQAEVLFRKLVSTYPLLIDYHRYYRALALYRAHRFTAALAATAKVSQDSVLALETRLLRASILHALQRLEEASEIWRDYLASYPRGSRADEAHETLADVWEARAKRAKDKKERNRALKRAGEQLVLLLTDTPLSNRVNKAEQRIRALVRRLPSGTLSTTLTAEQHLRRGQVLLGAMRNQEAERDFTEVLGHPELPAGLLCRSAYQRGIALLRQRQHSWAVGAFDEGVGYCRKAHDREHVLKCLFNLGRALVNTKQYERAVKAYLDIEREDAKHSYADDARLRAAEALVDLDRQQEAVALLESIPQKYPHGDMAREATWRLTREALIRGDTAAGLRYVEQELALGPTTAYDAAGRAEYWKARILQMRGKLGEALPIYESCVRSHPLSYYSLLAFNRLRNAAPRRYRQLYRELLLPASRLPRLARGVGRSHGALRSPELARALELGRLGLANDAEREVRAARTKLETTVQASEIWATALLYDQAQLWHLSRRLGGSTSSSYKTSYPEAEAGLFWRIAYPRAFRATVLQQAREAHIPSSLIWAIMREESGFVPTVESWANAVGLMQLLVPTAQTVAGKRLRVDRQRLMEPGLNIRLGAAYLSGLSRRFETKEPLVIAAYNAGQAAVARWLRASNDEIDLFVERIPYEQTRRYTKRVLSSLFVYAALYGPASEHLPHIDFDRRPSSATSPAPAR